MMILNWWHFEIIDITLLHLLLLLLLLLLELLNLKKSLIINFIGARNKYLLWNEHLSCWAD